jgi:hypothetical protein
MYHTNLLLVCLTKIARCMRWHPEDVNPEVAVMEKSPPQPEGSLKQERYRRMGNSATILDHTDKN